MLTLDIKSLSKANFVSQTVPFIVLPTLLSTTDEILLLNDELS